MATQGGSWRIEVRTLRVGGVTNFAHSYLAIVDDNGDVRWEIHGHPHDGGSLSDWSGVEDNVARLATQAFPLQVFIMRGHHTDNEVDTFLGPSGRTVATIWTGSGAEATRIQAGMEAVRDQINAAGMTYEIPGLGAGDARNSNAVTRTMIDFVRDYSVGRGIGEFGLPRSQIRRYWREQQALDLDRRAGRAEWIREAEATGVPLELLDDTIQNDDGQAALAPGIHRNLIKVNPSTGQVPDTIDDSLVWPPSLHGLVPRVAPRRPRLRQASRDGGRGATDMGSSGPAVAAAPGASDDTSAEGARPAAGDGEAVVGAAARTNDGPVAPAVTVAAHTPSGADTLLTVPGVAMSAGQREALMRLPAFSDPGDPLFRPAVWKYRDANAQAAERAVASGAVDAFGRPARPAFSDSDGAPADADGRPMAEALAGVDRSLGEAARTVDAEAAVAALQGAVNDVGDEWVRALSPREGRQANRLLPRLAVDGIAGPRTAEGVRLALHHAGGPRLEEALATRLGRAPWARTAA